jgi:predicted Fe-Mo cluster-binding NifX family protein
MAGLSAPAQRALAGAGINTLQQLAKKSEVDVLALHGMGPASIPTLRQALASAGLTFSDKATQPIKKVHR